VSDKDKSGTLSKAEVEELCEICLSKFIPNKKGEDSIVIQLIEYFTRLLFSCLDVDINTEEIPLQKLRDAIINVRKITLQERERESKEFMNELPILICFCRVILRVIFSVSSVESID
jgi:hypothetical protein